MSEKVVFNIYVCRQCLRECTQHIMESSDDVPGENVGHDDLNDCELIYRSVSAVKESD